MGTFGITYGLVGKALAIGAGTATITPTSAWEFENQSGTLGTNCCSCWNNFTSSV